MYKRFLALFLSLLMITSFTSIVATAKDVDYNSAHVDMVVGLGLMQETSNGRFLGDINVRWDEFSEILKCFQFDAAEHQNTEVTANEIAEHFVFIAGYEKIIETNAFALASNWGLFNGLGLTADSPITRYQMASIIVRFMDIEMVRANLSTSSIGYYIDRDATVMSEILKVEELSGIVTDNGFSGIHGASTIEEGTIVIDNTHQLNIDFNKFDVINYLGHDVDVLYSIEDDTMYEIRYIGYSNKDEVVRIETKDIVSISDSIIKYYDDDKTRTIRLSSGFICLKNNEYLASYMWEDLIPEEGYIEIIDNGSGTDILIVKEFVDYVVSGVLVVGDDYTIYSKNQTAGRNDFTKLAESDINYSVKSSKGTNLTIKDIKKGSILSIAKSGVFTEIILSTNTITNFTFGSLSKSDVWILESTVGLEFRVTNLYMEKNDELTKASYGDLGIVYLNAFGEVAYYEPVENTDITYACLVNVYYDSEGLDDTLYVKLLTPDGKEHLFAKNDKLRIKDAVGVSARYTPEAAYAKLYEKNEIVSFKQNTSGNLTEIVFFPLEEKYQKEGEMKKLYDGTVTFNSDNASFGHFVHRNTVYYVVDEENKKDIKEYTIMEDTGLLRQSGSYKVRAYGMDEKYADYVILYDLDENILMPRAEARFGVVLGTGQKYDEVTDEIYTYVVYNVDGSEIEVLCENEEVIEQAYDVYSKIPSTSQKYQVEEGDIVRFYQDPVTGIARACTILYKPTQKNPSFPSSKFGFIPGAEIGAHDGVSNRCNPFAIDGTFTATKALRTLTGYNNRIIMGWVYDHFDTTVQITNQDLSVGVYEGDTFEATGTLGWSVEMTDVSEAPVIIEYHCGELQDVRIGSPEDIRAYKDFSNDCSAYISIGRRWYSQVQTYVINHTW